MKHSQTEVGEIRTIDNTKLTEPELKSETRRHRISKFQTCKNDEEWRLQHELKESYLFQAG